MKQRMAIHSNLETTKVSSSLAMTIVLISWGMLFATLFLMYVIYRSSNPVWPPMGMERISLFVPTISLALMLISSLTFEIAKNAFKNNLPKKCKIYWWATFILGLGFLFFQTMLWKIFHGADLYASSGIFPSILHAFTWIHFVHMVLGVMGLMFLFPLLKKSHENGLMRFENVGKFWHFLGIIWLIMFVILFLI